MDVNTIGLDVAKSVFPRDRRCNAIGPDHFGAVMLLPFGTGFQGPQAVPYCKSATTQIFYLHLHLF